jgi:hypothetical protein
MVTIKNLLGVVLGLGLVTAAVAGVAIYWTRELPQETPLQVSLGDIISNPQEYDGKLVSTSGKVENLFYGWNYCPTLVGENRDRGIALEWTDSLTPYVGENVVVVGWVRYLGEVVDAPGLYVDIISISMKPENVASGVRFAMSLDKLKFNLGENIDVNLVVQNLRNENVTFTFSSGYQFDVVVYDENFEVVCAWSDDKAFIQVFTGFSLKPGESRNWVWNWNQTVHNRSTGEYSPVGSGTYRLLGVLVGYMKTTPLRITIS